MDANAWIAIAGLAFAVVGGLASLWKTLSSRIQKLEIRSSTIEADARVSEARNEAMRDGVADKLDSLEKGLERLSEDLRAHMSDEPEQLRRVLREFMRNNDRPESGHHRPLN